MAGSRDAHDGVERQRDSLQTSGHGRGEGEADIGDTVEHEGVHFLGVHIAHGHSPRQCRQRSQHERHDPLGEGGVHRDHQRGDTFSSTGGLERLVGQGDAASRVRQQRRPGRGQDGTTAGSFEHGATDDAFEVPYPFADRGLGHHKFAGRATEAALAFHRQEERQVPKVQIHKQSL